MPLYTYRCQDCSDVIELFQSHRQLVVMREHLRCAKCEGRMQHIFGVPAIRTDTAFMSGSDDGFGSDEFTRKYAHARARAAGVNPNGKRFFPQLCAPGVPYDPQAWVSFDNARGDIKKRCVDLNYAAEGDITVKQREPEHDPLDKKYVPADDIVAEKVNTIVAKEHGGKISSKKKAELTEVVAEKLAGNQ